jgi:hypothetical protein
MHCCLSSLILWCKIRTGIILELVLRSAFGTLWGWSGSYSTCAIKYVGYSTYYMHNAHMFSAMLRIRKYFYGSGSAEKYRIMDPDPGGQEAVP